MTKTELPSSVLFSYNPRKHGVGTERVRVDGNEITEPSAQRRKTRAKTTRVFHLRSRRNNEKPSKTMVITPGPHYDRVETRPHDSYVSQVIDVNNTHIRLGYVNNGVNGGSVLQKFGFGGLPIQEDEEGIQLRLGFYEETSEITDRKNEDVPNGLPQIPEEVNPHDVVFVKQTVEQAFNINSELHPNQIIKLSEVFQPLDVKPTPMQAELPVSIS